MPRWIILSRSVATDLRARPELAAYAVERLADSRTCVCSVRTNDAARSSSFVLAEVHAHDVITLADHRGLALRGGHHCNQPLMRKLGARDRARQLLFLQHEDEVDRMIEILAKPPVLSAGS